MSRALLLRVAASLALFTAVGHTAGIFMPIPPEQAELLALWKSMETTMVPLPMGSPRSVVALLDGANFCTTVLLVLCALLLFTVAGAKKDPLADRVIVLTASALLASAALAAIYFFPLPVLCTALGGALALAAKSKGGLA